MGFYDKIYSHSPLLVQNAMISLYGYHWMKRRMGGSFSELYKAAKERESFTESQWNDLENAALQKMLVHAFENVPYYKKTFSEVGSTIDDIKKITVDTIHKLPVLTKEQLRQFGTTFPPLHEKRATWRIFCQQRQHGNTHANFVFTCNAPALVRHL